MDKRQKILIVLGIFLIGMSLIRLWLALTSSPGEFADISREYRSITLGIAIGILFLISTVISKGRNKNLK